MWWAGSNPVDLYVGTRRVARVGPCLPAYATLVMGPEHALLTAAEQLQALAPRQRVRQWLSGGLCRPILLQPTAGAAPAEMEQIAQATAAQRTGLAAPCRVWIEGRRQRGPRLAVAVAEPVVAALETAARAARLSLISLQPWWADALRYALESRPANSLAGLGVHDCDSLTVFIAGPSGFAAVSHFSPVLDRNNALAVLARTVVAGAPGPGPVPCICLGSELLAGAGAPTAALALGPFVEVHGG